MLSGAESKVPVGILEASIELLPKCVQVLTEEVVSTQVSLEKNRQSERERLFLVYAKQWWKEYLQIRPNHGQRLVKIFAQVIVTSILILLVMIMYMMMMMMIELTLFSFFL